jgi:anti-anti-sigma factor
MAATFTIRNDTGLVILTGSLTLANADSFKQQFAEWFAAAAPAPRVVIDMSDVGFVDSSGLGALISLLRRVHQQKGEVAIRGLQPSVKTIFDITGAAKMFQFENNAPREG